MKRLLTTIVLLIMLLLNTAPLFAQEANGVTVLLSKSRRYISEGDIFNASLIVTPYSPLNVDKATMTLTYPADVIAIQKIEPSASYTLTTTHTIGEETLVFTAKPGAETVVSYTTLAGIEFKALAKAENVKIGFQEENTRIEDNTTIVPVTTYLPFNFAVSDPAQSPGATFELKRSRLYASPGEPITIDLYVDAKQLQISFAKTRVSYPANLLAFESVTLPPSLVVLDRDTSQEGIIDLGIAIGPSTTNVLNTRTLIARLTFKTKQDISQDTTAQLSLDKTETQTLSVGRDFGVSEDVSGNTLATSFLISSNPPTGKN